MATAAATLLLTTGGNAFGSPSAAQYEYGHPVPLTPPMITGAAAQTGQKLTVSNGTWQSDAKITLYAYQWVRCDAKGNNCSAIAGATTNSYTLADPDIAHTLRVDVTAVSANGPTQTQSPPTDVVSAGLPTGKQIDAKLVSLPNRLIVDSVRYSANPIRSRTVPTRMQVHVVDSRQNAVQNALVFVQGLPYSRIAAMPEVRTDSNGWASVVIQPGQFFPRTGYVVLFVRARVEGQDLLGGTSTRRLVQVTVAPPAR